MQIVSLAARWFDGCVTRRCTPLQLYFMFAAGSVLSGCTQRGDVLSPGMDAGKSVNEQASALSAGDDHVCGIFALETACWGSNAEGQLGIGDTERRLVPTRIVGEAQFQQLASGTNHTCALDDVGDVYCWGSNARGQLGLGHRTSSPIPVRVALPASANRIATKFDHSCAILWDGGLYCWGANTEGQLGNGDQYPVTDETAADGLSPGQVGNVAFREVDTGDGHTCAIAVDGSLWCWGRNSEHELGPEASIQARSPVRVTVEGPWLSVGAGQHHSCALRQDRSLWCWGMNTGHATEDGFPLGIASASELEAPTRVNESADWAAFRTNTFHSCAIKRNSELWCWGRNAEGQLGTGDLTPSPVPIPIGSGFIEVTVGRFETCAIASNGAALCTGKNTDGQVGTGDLEQRLNFSSIVSESI